GDSRLLHPNRRNSPQGAETGVGYPGLLKCGVRGFREYTWRVSGRGCHLSGSWIRYRPAAGITFWPPAAFRSFTATDFCCIVERETPCDAPDSATLHPCSASVWIWPARCC